MPDLETKPERRTSRLRWVGIVVAIVTLVVALVWFWGDRKPPDGAAAQAGSPVRSTLHLESFVLNLSDADQRSYLRVGVDLGLDHELKHGEDPPIAAVRDSILGVLAEGKVDDLETAGGKAKLKADLVRALRDRVPELGVEEVYFTEFLIQR
jgi:flagellar basal body-associated protein FliL